MNKLNFPFNSHSQIKKWWFPLSFIFILLIATFLRFYQLAQVPHGMTWDEAAIGYNGYAVLTTRRDEWLKRFPISFRSFGDYKAPLAIYANGFFTLVLGMNLWAVRFPFAAASVIAIAGWMILIRLLWRNILHSQHDKEWSLIAGVLMTFSPWHFHFSRVGFESGIALCLLIWGLVGLMLLLFGQLKKHLLTEVSISIFTSVMLVASIYTYHSSKIVIPFLVAVILLLFFKQAWSKKFSLGGIGALSAVLLVPFVYDSIKGNGGERLGQATIFGLNLPLNELVSQFIHNFAVHLSPSFLVMGATTTLRHGDGQWGVLYLVTLLFLLSGIIFGVRKSVVKTSGSSSLAAFKFALAWILIGLIPAAIGRDVPHSNRALLALPGFLLMAMYGLGELLVILAKSKLNKAVSGTKGEKNLLVKSVIGMASLMYFIMAASYIHHYFKDFNALAADDFKDGYLEAMEYARSNEADVDKILFTSAYGQPYIYALFTRQTNPIWYQGGSLIKYEFSDRINPGDMSRKNTVIIATPTEIEADRGQAVIKDAAGKVRFVLMKTP
jgi:hypothetical protein